MENKDARKDMFHLNRLLETLPLLAAPYQQQVASFPAFVHIPDEIAQLFDDAWMVSADELSEEGLIRLDQRKALEHMSETLDHMSQNKDLWTLSSLESSSEWANVRYLAHDILVSFQEAKRTPQLFWVQYIHQNFPGSSATPDPET